MAYDITLPTISVLVYTTVALVLYSVLDIRNRRVANRLMAAGGSIGVVIALLTGHMIEKALLHIYTFAIMLLFSILLFRLGAIGGADVKALWIVALVSPGIAFVDWSDPFIESTFSIGIELGVMLLLGYFYWQKIQKRNKETTTPPLIPMLLVGYLLVQLLVFI